MFGKGRSGAVYSWNGRQRGEKNLYIAPVLACCLYIGRFWVNIEILIKPRELCITLKIGFGVFCGGFPPIQVPWQIGGTGAAAEVSLIAKYLPEKSPEELQLTDVSLKIARFKLTQINLYFLAG